MKQFDITCTRLSLALPWMRQAILMCVLSVGWTHQSADAQTSSLPSASPSYAFYYGQEIPWESLGAFDVAIVEPGHAKPGWRWRINPATTVAAYVAVGEVHPTRDYFKRMQKPWRLGENTAWGSIVVDQSAPDWPEFYLKEVIDPLWQQGFRAFFLDTLDSFYLVAKTPEQQRAQIDGMARTITRIKQKYPQAKLIFNRGFEVLPQLHPLAHAVAAESLFRAYDAGKKQYAEVKAEDRAWLWNQLLKCKTDYKLPVIAIDYVPPDQRELARSTARQIAQLGAIPWVSNGELNQLGVSNVEVLPRQVLALHDGLGHAADVAVHEMHRLGTYPLERLGLDVQLVSVDSEQAKQLLKLPWQGRYAGVVMWYTSGAFPKHAQAWQAAEKALDSTLPLVVVGELPEQARQLARLGLKAGPIERLTAPLVAEKNSPHVGFEIEPNLTLPALEPLTLDEQTAPKSDVWLRLRAQSGKTADAVAVTPWGGFAAERFWKIELPQNKGARWAIQPMEFFKATLKLDVTIPRPDVTSDNGRRLLMIHVDGDGFPSRAEIPGTPLASEVMLTEFLEKYRLPATVSVIEGEISERGLYKALAPQMEGLARRMFALPHVELATHSLSHPFYWADIELGKLQADRPLSLKLPNYSYNVSDEIAGSARYINERLAPAGKRTRVMLWSGDTQPLEAPVQTAYEAGLLNMNGGYTTIRQSQPSWSLIAPLGIMKGQHFQIYAPNQNENVYTRNWTGPFYGFDKVIETFEMTERPERVKPVNIYFHTYIASKRASIESLHKVYGWAQSQQLHPIFASEYIERVLDWRRATVAQKLNSPDLLELRSGGAHLRQWRVHQSADVSHVNMQNGFAGHTTHGSDRFLHAIDSIATNVHSSLGSDLKGIPNTNWILLDASARLRGLTASGGAVTVRFDAHTPWQARVRSSCVPQARADVRASARTESGHQVWTLDGAHSGSTEVVFRCPQ